MSLHNRQLAKTLCQTVGSERPSCPAWPHCAYEAFCVCATCLEASHLFGLCVVWWQQGAASATRPGCPAAHRFRPSGQVVGQVGRPVVTAATCYDDATRSQDDGGGGGVWHIGGGSRGRGFGEKVLSVLTFILLHPNSHPSCCMWLTKR